MLHTQNSVSKTNSKSRNTLALGSAKYKYYQDKLQHNQQEKRLHPACLTGFKLTFITTITLNTHVPLSPQIKIVKIETDVYFN